MTTLRLRDRRLAALLDRPENFEGPVTLRDEDIAATLGYSRTSVYLAFGELEDLGALTRTERAAKGREYRTVTLNPESNVWALVRALKDFGGAR